jgi:CRP/FNR family transcriptional regulator, anaerobic regulatory protein
MEDNHSARSSHPHSQCNGQCRPAHTSCISLVPIFNHLEPEQMDEIMSVTRSAAYKKGETIYRPGEASDTLYIVNSGLIRIYRLAESGKEQLVRFLHPGDFTGELALFSESEHESFAEAAKDTKVCVMQRSDLQGFLMKYPVISLKLLQEFSNRLERSEKQTTYVATEKVETRLALYLAELLEPGDEIVTLPMSKKDLASYLGTTPETISRKLGSLEDRRLIQQLNHKKIKLLDLDGLLLV